MLKNTYSIIKNASAKKKGRKEGRKGKKGREKENK